MRGKAGTAAIAAIMLVFPCGAGLMAADGTAPAGSMAAAKAVHVGLGVGWGDGMQHWYGGDTRLSADAPPATAFQAGGGRKLGKAAKHGLADGDRHPLK